MILFTELFGVPGCDLVQGGHGAGDAAVQRGAAPSLPPEQAAQPGAELVTKVLSRVGQNLGTEARQVGQKY